jgi:hypothetical protein
VKRHASPNEDRIYVSVKSYRLQFTLEIKLEHFIFAVYPMTLHDLRQEVRACSQPRADDILERV